MTSSSSSASWYILCGIIWSHWSTTECRVLDFTHCSHCFSRRTFNFSSPAAAGKETSPITAAKSHLAHQTQWRGWHRTPVMIWRQGLWKGQKFSDRRGLMGSKEVEDQKLVRQKTPVPTITMEPSKKWRINGRVVRGLGIKNESLEQCTFLNLPFVSSRFGVDPGREGKGGLESSAFRLH